MAEFWSRFLKTGTIDSSTSAPDVVEPFGDSAELADKLIELVIHGSKRATAGALVDFDLEGVLTPQPGTISIATDGAGRARAVLCTTDVRIGPLSSVDDQLRCGRSRTRSWSHPIRRHFRDRFTSLHIRADDTSKSS